jgi:hypothetical protein
VKAGLAAFEHLTTSGDQFAESLGNFVALNDKVTIGSQQFQEEIDFRALKLN